MTSYCLQAGDWQNPRVPSITLNCGRISVVLGANGSGKTRLLNRIMELLRRGADKNRFVYVEGGRAFRDKIMNIDPNSETLKFIDHPESLQRAYVDYRGSEITHRIQLSLQLLKLKSRIEREQHVAKVEAWSDAGCTGPKPVKNPTSLRRMFELFSEVFPDITLRVHPERS